MVWMVLALMLSVVCFIANTMVARMATEAGFTPTNVGYAYGVYGAWFTTPIAVFALFVAGAPNGLFITVGVIVFIVPYFLGQLPVVKRRIDATTTLIRRRHPRHV